MPLTGGLEAAGRAAVGLSYPLMEKIKIQKNAKVTKVNANYADILNS